jgi:hypothetical protein
MRGVAIGIPQRGMVTVALAGCGGGGEESQVAVALRDVALGDVSALPAQSCVWRLSSHNVVRQAAQSLNDAHMATSGADRTPTHIFQDALRRVTLELSQCVHDADAVSDTVMYDALLHKVR